MAHSVLNGLLPFTITIYTLIIHPVWIPFLGGRVKVLALKELACWYVRPVRFFPLLISFVDYMNSEHCSITSISSQPTASTRASDNCAPDIMSLTALPIELMSRVCCFPGREPSEYGKRIVYKNKDFQSLRSTCRDIYAKNTYDASVR
jgi:hypothetical protein